MTGVGEPGMFSRSKESVWLVEVILDLAKAFYDLRLSSIHGGSHSKTELQNLKEPRRDAVDASTNKEAKSEEGCLPEEASLVLQVDHVQPAGCV